MHLTRVSDDDWIGRVIDGRYRVLALVGTGGMGAVYRVQHVRLGKLAAMKVLHRTLAGDPAAVRRFRREVQAVSRLDHPNIVQTFDCGDAGGQLYLVMEYLRGDDLAGILWRQGPLPVARALALAEQICAALEEAHERGVVHCDLKPDNVMCARRRGLDQAKVLDFGLAKLRGGPDAEAILLGGTPGYMSPEQIRGESIDARSDLYSLGATLYRMLTGEVPFEGGSSLEVMRRQLTEPLVPPSVRAPRLCLPMSVDDVVERAMARRREDRYRSAAELRADLRAALAPVSGPVTSFAESDPDEETVGLRREHVLAFERQLRRRRRLAALLVAPVVLAAMAMAGGGALALVNPGAISEHEPNDLAALATPLPRGRTVLGQVGPAHADGRPDFDYYRIRSSPRPRAVTAHLAGVPGLDLILELYDERGRLLARANSAPAGGDERLGPVTLGRGEAFVRARPLWTAGIAAGPGTTPYTLTVNWDARQPPAPPARSGR